MFSFPLIYVYVIQCIFISLWLFIFNINTYIVNNSTHGI